MQASETKLSLTVPDEERHDLAAEGALLGSMVMDTSIITKVTSQVSTECFFRPEHRLVFDAIRDQYEDSGDSGYIDLVLLRNRMKDNKTIEAAGGVEYLVKIHESVPSAESWQYYANIVLDKAAYRRCLSILDEAWETLRRTQEPLTDRIEQIRRLFTEGELTRYCRSLDLIRADSVQPKTVEWLVDDVLPLGMLSLIAGEPGAGKTFCSMSLAAAVTTGRPWPTPRNNPAVQGSVLILSDEDDLPRVLLPRLIANEADTSKVHVQDAATARPFHVTGGLYRLQATLDSLGDCRLIILDPITAYMEGINANSNAEVRSALVGLQRLAEQYNIAVAAVSHFSKKVDLGAIHRTLGSIAFTAAARSVWAVVKEKRDAGDAGRDSRLWRCLMPVKCNYAIRPRGIRFCIEEPDGAVTFDANPIDQDVDEMMTGPESGMTSRARDDAEQWLHTLLNDGQMPATAVRQAADQEGHSWSTIKRISGRNSCIDKWKSGTDGQWYWQLRQHP
ncbi:MAG: AAA family ATPase [Sedimentisphaerales bacterium]|nr:AAA family ATPase [Sedimentisphaerales bacterium]